MFYGVWWKGTEAKEETCIYWLGKSLWLSAKTSVVEDFGKKGVHMLGYTRHVWSGNY